MTYSKISDCDWVLEAVIENLKIKNQVFEEVEKHRKPGTIVSTNTSGIPINHIAEERSDDFKKNFIGTHFFNPTTVFKTTGNHTNTRYRQAIWLIF